MKNYKNKIIKNEKKTMTEKSLTAKESVVKPMNSKNRYLKIPENEFNEIAFNDVAEVVRKETEKSIDLIYRFNKIKR